MLPLAAGGGNETSAAAAAPPPLGAVPTFSVDSLAQLQQRLAQRDTALGWGAPGNPGSILSSSDGSSSSSDEGELGLASMAGAPPLGLDFLIFALTVLEAATCSFPRIDSSRFGSPPDRHPGDRVLHLACGNGALTKLLFSSGLQASWDGGVVGSCSAQRVRIGFLPVPPLPSISHSWRLNLCASCTSHVPHTCILVPSSPMPCTVAGGRRG